MLAQKLIYSGMLMQSAMFLFFPSCFFPFLSLKKKKRETKRKKNRKNLLISFPHLIWMYSSWRKSSWDWRKGQRERSASVKTGTLINYLRQGVDTTELNRESNFFLFFLFFRLEKEGSQHVSSKCRWSLLFLSIRLPYLVWLVSNSLDSTVCASINQSFVSVSLR